MDWGYLFIIKSLLMEFISQFRLSLSEHPIYRYLSLLALSNAEGTIPFLTVLRWLEN